LSNSYAKIHISNLNLKKAGYNITEFGKEKETTKSIPSKETFSAKSKDNLGFIVGAPTGLEIQHVRLEGYRTCSDGCS
jgi:hypothetical protein